MTAWDKWRIAGVATFLLGCGHAPTREAPDPLVGYNVAGVEGGDVRDFGGVYQRMGVVSSGPPISFVANPAFFATATPETTLVVVSLSLPNRGLTFQREGALFRADYDVTLTLTRNGVEVRRLVAADTIRVATLGETNRTDESIIFRQVMRVPPGSYSLSYVVHDVEGGRQAAKVGQTEVPRFGTTSFSRPVVIYEATPRAALGTLPQYLPAPRASVTFGVERSLPVYLEVYGTKLTTPVFMSLADQNGRMVWHDTAWLAQRQEFAAGVVDVPLVRADAGVYTISVARADEPKSDTLRTPIFIGFGPDLPLLTYGQMIHYLRYFASPDALQQLRDATPEDRGKIWGDFLHASDPSPETSQNEALLDYFTRIREANALYRAEATEGWLSDRGSVYVALGMPDGIYDQYGRWLTFTTVPPVTGGRRYIVWEYLNLQARIVFTDETGAGQWQMVPASRSNFWMLVSRRTRR